MKYKRVLIKLSGEALMGKEKSSKVLDKEVMFEMANQIKALANDGVEIGIVIGGGNIFRGKYNEVRTPIRTELRDCFCRVCNMVIIEIP